MSAESASFLQIAENINFLNEDIERIKKEHHIDREITVLAATKTVPPEKINYAIDHCGIRVIGENRADELVSKYDAVHKDKAELHFIGALQSNKVRQIIDKVSLIHSLDRLSLAKEIDRQAKIHGKVMDCLIEINSGHEFAKSGVMPEDFEDFLEQIDKFDSISVRGIMTIAPNCEKKDEYCKYFSKTYQLFIDILQKKHHNIDIPILSMGMSGSYEQAILCGATMIRPGSLIFGQRSYH